MSQVGGRPSRRRVDRAAVVWGVVFTVIGLAYLLEDQGVWVIELAVLAPLLLIVAGLALAASALLPDRQAGPR